MQLDGNLVVSTSGGTPIWSSGTNGHNGAYLSMQGQGNAVIYDSGGPIWSTNGCGYSSGAYLVLKDDGNLVLRNADGSSRWSSKYGCGHDAPHTLNGGQILQAGESIWSPSGGYYAAMQHDGSFVVRDAATGNALWTSPGTFGHSGAFASMQTQGNFVVYYDGGNWSTNACGYSPGAYLAMQDDGNLVLKNANGSVRWSSYNGCGP
jgi:hypothetical protein